MISKYNDEENNDKKNSSDRESEIIEIQKSNEKDLLNSSEKKKNNEEIKNDEIKLMEMKTDEKKQEENEEAKPIKNDPQIALKNTELEDQIIDYEEKTQRPNVKAVSLTTQANLDKAFSTDIIIITLEYIGKDKKVYSWDVRQTYKKFKKMAKFCEERLPERKKTIKINHELTQKERAEKERKEKTLPKNYLDIFYKIYKLSFSKAKLLNESMWISFIQIILNSFLYSFTIIKEFFEISEHSFVSFNNGIKPKEGEIIKQAEYSVCQTTCIDMCHCIKCFCCAGKNKYWFLLKPDMICFLDNSNSNIGKGTFWFDNQTSLEKKKGSLILRNSMRKIKLTFDEEFQRNLWFSEIDWRLKKYKENYVENKYGSFVLEKENCKCQWFVDGKDYFEDLKKRLLNAKETVFITDWWMSPELFLTRPVKLEKYKNLKYGEPLIEENPTKLSRLCDILNYIAKKGVRIYILLFCEFSLALTLNSKHTKIFLTGLSPNIKVIRHPKKSFDLLWSHHEKLVVIDQEYAYVGGLDLCWGRYDCHSHPITEPENENEEYEFPFIDYSNARINDFMNVPEYLKENVPRKTSVKMPWHDIHSLIQGPAVLDIARHFVERWNYSKSSESSEGITDVKTQYTKRFTTNKVSFFKGWLGNAIMKVSNQKNGISELEKDIRKESESKRLDSRLNSRLVNESLNKEPVNPFLQGKKAGFSFKNLWKKKEDKKVEIEDNNNEEIKLNEKEKESKNNESKNNNDKKEIVENDEINTNRKIPFSEANKINTDFYKDITKSNTKNAKDEEEMNFDQIAGRKTEDGYGVHIHKKKIDYLAILKAGMKKNIKTFTQKKNSTNQLNKLSNYINLNAYNVNFSLKETKMKCQCLRSLCYWSGGLNTTEISVLKGYYELIENSKHYIYIENQFFISKSFTDEEWEKRGKKVSNLIINEIALKLRQRIEKAHKNKEKFRVMIIIPLLPGFAGSPEESSTLQVILKFTYKSISRNDGLSLIEKLKELLDENDPELFKQYIGFFSLRNHSELNGIPVTELIYIHSKLMIVDDQKVIMGSANINDRSMTGERDSEFAVIFSDLNEEKPNSLMDGKPYSASKFAKSLRVSLLREHLGLKSNETNYTLIEDMLNDDVWKLINDTAKKNTDIYRELFKCYPDDTMLTFKDVPSYKELNDKEKEVLIDKYKVYKKEIKGHIVEFPYDFLKNQILERSFFSAEMLVPIKNFV